MLPFEIRLRNGPPVYEQLLYAVRKAVVSGVLREGDGFPSVRVISRELKVNPNTVQKAVGMLKRDGYLEVQPGVGMVVGRPVFGDPGLKREFLGESVEGMVLRARELGVGMGELVKTIKEHWERMEP